MRALPAQFNLIETQGCFTVAVYVHYFMPGSLKLHTNIQFLSPESFEDTFSSTAEQVGTRRWLPHNEAPYPGYCRSPGSSKCNPLLCDCEQLTQIWNKVQVANAALKNSHDKQNAKLWNVKDLTKDSAGRS